MKLFIKFFATAILVFCTQILNAQETEIKTENEILRLETLKTKIINDEKELLKKEVEAINLKIDTKEITSDQGKTLKEEAAERRALNIENQLAIINNKIAWIKRNGLSDQYNLETWIKNESKKVETKKIKYDIRTNSSLVVSVGFNNVITKGESFEDSDFKFFGSRYFEIGFTRNTRVFENSNFLRFRYGISYQSNGLKPTGNRYFVENGNQTDLEEFRLKLDKSKFRLDYLVLPIHFEFGPSKKEESEIKLRYSTHRRFKIGIGGYFGGRIGVRQKLKYEEEGKDIKDKLKRNYNTNRLIYGLSTYVGIGDTSMYIKYDLSTIFKDATVDQNNVSLGLRFDF